VGSAAPTSRAPGRARRAAAREGRVIALHLLDQTADVERCGRRRQLAQRLEHGEGVLQRELVVAEGGDALVHLEDLRGGQAQQTVPVQRRHHVTIAVQPADQRDHPLCEFFSGLPVVAARGEVVHQRPCKQMRQGSVARNRVGRIRPLPG
jgi:hypothetical protein